MKKIYSLLVLMTLLIISCGDSSGSDSGKDDPNIENNNDSSDIIDDDSDDNNDSVIESDPEYIEINLGQLYESSINNTSEKHSYTITPTPGKYYKITLLGQHGNGSYTADITANIEKYDSYYNYLIHDYEPGQDGASEFLYYLPRNYNQPLEIQIAINDENDAGSYALQVDEISPEPLSKSSSRNLTWVVTNKGKKYSVYSFEACTGYSYSINKAGEINRDIEVKIYKSSINPETGFYDEVTTTSLNDQDSQRSFFAETDETIFIICQYGPDSGSGSVIPNEDTSIVTTLVLRETYVPPIPSELAVQESNNELVLSWPVLEGIEKYNVYVSCNDIDYELEKTITVSNNDVIEYAFEVTDPETVRYFKLSGIVESFESAKSESVSGSVAISKFKPDMPDTETGGSKYIDDGVSIYSLLETEYVAITFPVYTGVDKYVVMRGRSPDECNEIIHTVDDINLNRETLRVIDFDVEIDQTYYYRIVSRNNNRDSLKSDARKCEVNYFHDDGLRYGVMIGDDYLSRVWSLNWIENDVLDLRYTIHNSDDIDYIYAKWSNSHGGSKTMKMTVTLDKLYKGSGIYIRSDRPGEAQNLANEGDSSVFLSNGPLRFGDKMRLDISSLGDGEARYLVRIEAND